LQKVIFIFILISFFRVQPDCRGSDSLEYIIQEINIEGNKVTKDKIILRELVFNINKSYSASELEKLMLESRENLLNTQLFNFVTIEKTVNSSTIEINIHIIERWYIWPVPLFEHAERNLPAFLKNPDLQRTNYGLQLNWTNFRGMNEELHFKARLGYKEQFSITYFKPNIDRDQKHGIGFGYNLFRQHEARYMTFDNEPLLLKNEDDYLLETLSASLMYSYRPGIHLSSRISIEYKETSFRNDSLHIDFLGIEQGKYLRNFDLSLNTSFEKRDNIAYPLEGNMLSFSLLQRGLGLISDYPLSKTIITIIASHHQNLTNKLYLDNATKIRLSKNEHQPYFLREALGGATYLRGFEYKLIDGNSYFLSVNNLKFALLPEIDHQFKWIPWEQFNKIHYSLYSKIFFDAAFVSSPVYQETSDKLTNTWLYSVGVGFDFVTYYDQVLRLEFTQNSIGQFGVFLHMETVFKRW
jgi:outer membrane protein assembly factor BamA